MAPTSAAPGPAEKPTDGDRPVVRLTMSGKTTPLPPLPDAQDPPEAKLTPELTVAVPNDQCPRMLNLVSPAIAIPTTSPIREIEAFWNSSPLTPVDVARRGLTEEAHSEGSMVPFSKPVYSLASLPAGAGILEIRGLDHQGHPVTKVRIPRLTVAAAPRPIVATQVAAHPHPRLYLTPARLAQVRRKDGDGKDPSAQRFWSSTEGLGTFLDALRDGGDVTSHEFADHVYNPEGFLPALALCYQLRKDAKPKDAATCADAAKRMALQIANEYRSGARRFGRDSGYDIRFSLRNLMLAYDWLYERFTPAERALMTGVATEWVDWYAKDGYTPTRAVENYYAGYLQGLAMTAIATAGDNPAADRLLALLQTKLTDEMPIVNQRVCGGDWPEGWNYGAYSVVEFALVRQALQDLGVDWGAVFGFIDPVGRSLLYQVAPDFTQTPSFGGYSGERAHKTSPSLLAVLSSTTTGSGAAAAAHIYESMLARPESDLSDSSRGDTFYEMIFAVPRGSLAKLDVSSWPGSYLSSGDGRFFSKSSLQDPAAYQVTAENVSYGFDHYGYANGDVRLYHGSTCLLCPSAYRGGKFDGEGTTPAFSTYLVNGKAQSGNRNNQILFYNDAGGWSAIGMRFESSWAVNRYDEGMFLPDVPLDYLIREVVHVRPGTLVVRDLHRRRHAGDTLVARWHLGPSDSPRRTGEGRFDIGSLHITTFAPAGVMTEFAPDKDQSGARIGTLMTQTFPAGVRPMESIAIFSESATGVGVAAHVLKLSDRRCVTFAGSDVRVAACP